MILGGMRRNEAFYTLHHFTRIALSRWPRLAILQLSFLGLLVHWLNHMSNVIKMDIINDKTHGYVLWQLWKAPLVKSSWQYDQLIIPPPFPSPESSSRKSTTSINTSIPPKSFLVGRTIEQCLDIIWSTLGLLPF